MDISIVIIITQRKSVGCYNVFNKKFEFYYTYMERPRH